MDVIWAKREAIYFCRNGWTGSISLIGFEKFADWREEANRATPRAQKPNSTLKATKMSTKSML